MTRFLINKNGVYYLTTGKLLEYSERQAGGNPAKAEGVRKAMGKFVEIMNSSTTMYGAVEISDSSFAPMNTGSTGGD